MHQVGFTQAYTAIKEQRVVTVLGVVRHLPGCGPGQLVGLTLNKVLEGKGAVQVAGVLERAFNLDGTLLGANRSLLRTGAGHWVEAVTRRFLLADFSGLGRRTLVRWCRRWHSCRRGSSLNLGGRRCGQWRIRRSARSGTAFAAY
ncbi:hypothetical protein D3C76_1268020 [compost metagenome]